MTAIPMECRPCSVGLVEVPEGQVPAMYRRLVFDNEKQPATCPNCGVNLTPLLTINTLAAPDLTRSAA